ncbi:hypothetical protein [Pseudomonas sp. NFACC37-1]|uniref:hypothetical protein n=1 Tax=Pseudomonas sp. NFACC37-1 TaxID=1566196 RepID=UPI0008860DE1|nr:hypothetical protein [Pseudomonas sp. NFACC37-1]SCY13528.1 hypothetical protein SAMN03159391_01050 [Pseudomonas sp. NFACC37-1]
MNSHLERTMISIKQGLPKGAKRLFADFIRNAKSKEKKRVYRMVLAEATKQQNLVMMQAEVKRA